MENKPRRTEYEQLEFQRTHPHLFTSMSQSVNPDGSITSYEQVTVKLREQRDKIVELIAEHDSTPGHFPGDECVKEPIETLAYISGELKKCSEGFVRHYAQMRGLHAQRRQLSQGEANS